MNIFLFVVGVEVLTLLMGSTYNYPPEGPVLRWPIPYRFLKVIFLFPISDTKNVINMLGLGKMQLS